MIFWKNKWKKELDLIIDKSEKPEQNRAPQPTKVRRKGVMYGAISLALSLVMTFVLCFTLIPTSPLPNDQTVYMLEINPAVVFVVDSQNKVTSVSSVNADSDIVLSNEQIANELKGKDIEVAMEKYFDSAMELGFINFNGDVVRISTLNGDSEQLSAKLQDYAREKGVFVAVATDKLTETQFAERAGVTTENEGELVKVIKDLPRLTAQNSSNIQHIVDEYMNKIIEMLLEIINDQDYELDFETFERLLFLTQQGFTDIEGFVNNIDDGLDTYNQYLKDKNKNDYEGNDRQPMSQEDFDRHLQDLVDREGDLSQFFDKQNGKKPHPEN